MYLGFLYVSSWLIAHFCLALNNTALSRCTTVYLFIHLLKAAVVASKFWQLWIKLLETSLCKYLCGYGPGQVAQWVGTRSIHHNVASLSQSGHGPRLQVWVPGGCTTEATNWCFSLIYRYMSHICLSICLSLFLSLPLPQSLRSISILSGED